MASRFALCGLILGLAAFSNADLLLRGGLVVDGTGRAPVRADVRISGDRITQIGRLKARQGDTVVQVAGYVVAPGFIDAHSHADGAMDKLESQVRQGITTAVVGQDGFNAEPLDKFFGRLETKGAELNFAAFYGHGTARSAVMKDDFKRGATGQEITNMTRLVGSAMAQGALGLSSGLEYDPGHYASTAELAELAKVAARSGGLYISHVRDEGNGAMKSFDELVRICGLSGSHGQVSHIKVAMAGVWGRAGDALRLLQNARAAGIPVTADIYPYSYWQSSITALTVSRDWGNPAMWEEAVKENGGADKVTLVEYSPDRAWQGKTLAHLSDTLKKPVGELVAQIVAQTQDNKGEESIQCQAMTERDIETFMRWPWTMFCSDGTGGGSHPRSAGAFPRVYAEYVRRRHVLTLQEAVRKMTQLPASTLRLGDRGVVAKGALADIVVFDPKTIADRADASHPTRYAVGVRHVIVNGKFVLKAGKMSGAKPGRAIRRQRGSAG